jgi:hypothetical protein
MAALPIEHKALTLQDVIRKVEENPNVTRIQLAKELNMPITTLNGIMVKKDVLLTRMEDVSSNVKRSRVGKYYKAEEKLLVWFKQTAAVGEPTDGTTICAKAVETADQLNVEFNPSNGWTDRFRKRTSLVLRTISGESQSMNLTEAKYGRQRIYFTYLKGTGHVMSSTLTNVGYSIQFTQQDICLQGRKVPQRKIKERQNNRARNSQHGQ